MPTEQLANIPEPDAAPVGNKHQYNVSLSDIAFSNLGDLADAGGMSRAQVIRLLIQRAHQMIIHNIPVCVNGSRCYAPNMHPPPQSAPHQTVLPQ